MGGWAEIYGRVFQSPGDGFNRSRIASEHPLLVLALRTLPLSAAYAVRTGIGLKLSASQA